MMWTWHGHQQIIHWKPIFRPFLKSLIPRRQNLIRLNRAYNFDLIFIFISHFGNKFALQVFKVVIQLLLLLLLLKLLLYGRLLKASLFQVLEYLLAGYKGRLVWFRCESRLELLLLYRFLLWFLIKLSLMIFLLNQLTKLKKLRNWRSFCNDLLIFHIYIQIILLNFNSHFKILLIQIIVFHLILIIFFR